MAADRILHFLVASGPAAKLNFTRGCQNGLFYIYSVNQVRIRDVVEQDENMFEIHRLENIHVVSGNNPSSSEFIYSTYICNMYILFKLSCKVTQVPVAEVRRIPFQSLGFCVQA